MTVSPDPALPTSASVVIIGGGIMGASAAFHLAEAGVKDVLLLERGLLASGSTSKAAGGVRAQFSDPVNIELGARGLEAFENFHERPGWAIDLHQVGYLFVITEEDDLAVYEESIALQQRMGVQSRLLTPREAHELSPGIIVDDLLAAAFHPRDGYCSPESVVHGYAAGARRHGAVVRTGVTVEGIEMDGAAIVAVHTGAGVVRASTVVCTAGAWSKEIGAMAGVPLDVEPLRRQILITEPLDESLASVLPSSMPMTIDAATTFYLHREGPGVLLGMSYAGESPGFTHDYSEDWMPELVDAMERRCPSLLDVGIAHRWSGLYEVTPDSNALIGEAAGVERFLYAAGFSGHGFLQGPAVGEVLRDLYLHREPPVDVRPFAADRFAFGGLRAEHNIV
jgi:sarcosine oxidase, subunit beta